MRTARAWHRDAGHGSRVTSVGLLLVLAAACGDAGGTGSSLDSGDPDAPGDGASNDGGQTTDFGDGVDSACRVLGRDAVALEEARAAGSPFAAHLALLETPTQTSFHRGNFACDAEPSADGSILIETELSAVFVERRALVPELEGMPEFEGACLPLAIYDTTVTLTTSEGSFAGTFAVELVGGTGSSYGVATTAIENARGSLSLWLESGRSHDAGAALALGFGDQGSEGWVETLVEYTDGNHPSMDEGEALFWPALASSQSCEWLGTSAHAGTEMSIDGYRASYLNQLTPEPACPNVCVALCAGEPEPEIPVGCPVPQCACE